MQEAQDKFDYIQSLVHSDVGLQILYELTGGFDFSAYPLDGPVPELPPSNATKSRLELLQKLAKGEQMTIRQLYLRAAAGRAHRTIIGTPESIADDLQTWFEGGAADGFAVLPAYFPDGLKEFATHVIPELQRRGLFRTEYSGHTLRENLGLPAV
jgi:alkanesulfonate monooxygenase SsuD/methylene tetrahydromethanopterin reductase-like flavin-dependent oxidoreductase (luciferase family)